MKYKILYSNDPKPEGKAIKVSMDGSTAYIYEADGNTRRIDTDRSEVVVENDELEQKSKLYKVPFVIGDGTDAVMLEGIYFNDGMLRDENHLCAFCHGDPCAEDSDETTLIGAYFKRNKRYAETCPMCNGRPS